MKTEDIDKRIGMPDIDAEWVKFEREVMGRKTRSRKLIVWGISTAASIALLAGLLFWGHYIKDTEPLLARQEQPITMKEAGYSQDAETEPEVAQATMRLTGLAEGHDATSVSDLTKPDLDLQGRIAGLAIVPNSASLGNNSMHLRGTSKRNDSILILMDGTPIPVSMMTFSHLTQDLYRQRKCIDSIRVYRNESIKEQYIKQYGEQARYGVVVVKTAPDTLCDAYIREHPELMKSRRFVEGFVLSEKGEPLADAWVHIIRGMAGAATDSAGHFAFWLPLTDIKLQAECTGYVSSVRLSSSDSILTFRLRDATRLIDVPIRRKSIVIRGDSL